MRPHKWFGWYSFQSLVRVEDTAYQDTFEWQRVCIFYLFGIPLRRRRLRTMNTISVVKREKHANYIPNHETKVVIALAIMTRNSHH